MWEPSHELARVATVANEEAGLLETVEQWSTFGNRPAVGFVRGGACLEAEPQPRQLDAREPQRRLTLLAPHQRVRHALEALKELEHRAEGARTL